MGETMSSGDFSMKNKGHLDHLLEALRAWKAGAATPIWSGPGNLSMKGANYSMSGPAGMNTSGPTAPESVLREMAQDRMTNFSG